MLYTRMHTRVYIGKKNFMPTCLQYIPIYVTLDVQLNRKNVLT